MKYTLLIILLAFCMTSCNDWLDVRPRTEQKDYDQFSTVDGFFDALVGTYMEMAAADAYGERLTISNVESMANQWYMPESSVYASRLEDWYLTSHDYTSTDGRTAIAAFYAKLFSIIANANMVIRYADEQGDVFVDTTMRNMVQGEAYAIRAYCQLDVLRIFGQMPQGGSRQVQLPYSFTTSISEMPAYYSFDEYVELLKRDLAEAERLLENNDPLFEYTFAELSQENDEVPDNHLLYRQFRLNYWAVKALQARTHLYLGETADAYRIAKEIIDAKAPDGNPVRSMTGATDIPNGYRLCPNECLFALSKHDIMTNTIDFLLGGATDVTFSDGYDLGLSTTRLNELYAGEITNGNLRYAECWRTGVRDNSNQPNWAVTMKYWWEEDEESAMLNCQLVPMLRMSEVYLIAMETSTDLAEVNGWYKTYMVQRNVGTSTDFASLDAVRTWVRAEYCREFIAEGQAFYTYKRAGATTMFGTDRTMGESDYILPLPDTEYNPNNL